MYHTARVALAAALLCVASTTPLWAATRYEMPGAVSPRAMASRRLGRAGAHETLPMSVTLGIRHADELQALLNAQQTVGDPAYHRWLSPTEFAARFAPSAQEYNALADWLERQGFAVQRWESRLRIDFAGSVARAERTFGVRMNYYSEAGHARIANENAPLLPIEFSDLVDFVRLDTFPLARPQVRIVTASGITVNAMAPRDLQVAYNVSPVLSRGINGAGATIAIVARSDYNDSDVSRFQVEFPGGASHLPVKVFPTGNPGIGASNGVCKGIGNAIERQQCIQGEQGEVLLDVEWANALAPSAGVLVDIAGVDIDQSMQDVVNHHPEAKIVSISFGACERVDQADQILFGGMYAQAAAQGQTVLVATGDDGADDCQDGRGASVSVLATNVNVTAVGGTALDPGFNGGGNATAYVNESVWNDALGSSGGGPSILVGKPAYQNVLGVPADGARDIPDVSLLASPNTAGYVAIDQNRVIVVGGTSAAAPNWAGIVALLNQAARVDGSGALNTRFYALGRQQFGGGGTAVFHDVVSGDNSFNGVAGFAAGPGYDLTTGLGTPDVAALVGAFAAPPCAGDCNGDGVVTIDELVTGVEIALGVTPVAQCAALDANGDGVITVDELLQAVHNLLNGC